MIFNPRCNDTVVTRPTQRSVKCTCKINQSRGGSLTQSCDWLQDLGAAGGDGGLSPEDHHHHDTLHRGSAASSHGQYLLQQMILFHTHIIDLHLSAAFQSKRQSLDLNLDSGMDFNFLMTGSSVNRRLLSTPVTSKQTHKSAVDSKFDDNR